MKILLLEDNVKLNNSITKRLKLKGYKVSSFIDGADAYDSMDDGYSCFVLDINVPSLNGVELLKKIREYYSTTPVIIISATVELDIIKDAYGFGCDDFIKKPFFIDELEIKIEKLCSIDDDVVYFGEDCSFCCRDSMLLVAGKEHHLTKKERLLANILLKHRGRVVTFDMIQDYVWEGNIASLESIRSLVRRLRKLLDNKYIETVVGAGYILR